jgi:predicted AAA+ superfamily ATPase
MYIHRHLESGVLKAIRNFPVTAVTGPRQCGKSTLVKHLLDTYPEFIDGGRRRTKSDINSLMT